MRCADGLEASVRGLGRDGAADGGVGVVDADEVVV